MSLDHYDAPTGAYTSRIPPGTTAFRRVIAEHFGFSRTEVIRDQSRCAQTRSEHCECGAVDCFTVLFEKGRPFFDWCVANADALGVQSVIFQHRQIGFGNPTERHRAKADHMDHVHVGLNRAARQNLTEVRVRALLPGAEEDFLAKLTEDEQQEVLSLSRENRKALYKRVDGVDREHLNEIDGRLTKIEEALARIEAKP